MRLNASQSPSYVLGGGEKGGELPRFERPLLKQAKSAYTSTSSPRVAPKSSLSSSSGFFRSRNGHSHDQLPLTSSPNPGLSGASSSCKDVKPRSKVRAAISGREGGIQGLPDWSRTTPSPSNSFEYNSPAPRARTSSMSQQQEQYHLSPQMQVGDYDYDSDEEQMHHNHHVKQRRSGNSSHNNHSSHHETPASSRALRQRKGTPDEYHSRPPRQTNSGESPYRLPNKRRTPFILKRPCQKWSLTNIVQAAVAFLLTFLLYDGHHKASLIANRLKEFKSEEAMLFLHLHRIEQQSIQLHEALQRLDLNNNNNNNNNNNSNQQTNDKEQDSEYLQDIRHGHPNNTPNIDSALIQKQTQLLMQMEEELSTEVRTLQTRIQHSAVRSIVHEYGEGPVQVIWEVVVDGQTSKISILLWHDTPHAAWTWLEQISKKLWDGAQVHLENNRILGVGSTHSQVAQEARLDFIERSQQRHEAWTVGLSDATGNGGLQVFINLQDNTEFSRHNVCIGKVFDGFDVLHKMVEQTRQMQLVAGGQQPPPNPITIKSARASHLTNRETKGLI